jgi:hypothetical protein
MIARGGGVLPVAVELVMQVRNLPTVFPLALALAGCVAGSPTGAATGGGTPNRGTGAGSGNGGSNTGGSAGSSGMGTEPPLGAPATVSATPECQGDELPGPRRLRLLTRAEYAATVTDLLFLSQPPLVDNLPVESVVDGFNNHATAQVVTSRHLDEFLATGERLVTQALAQNKGRLVTCAGAPGCDRMFISSFGRRAFRRPLSADEVQRYSLLFAPSITNNSFDTGVELAMRAMLASPHFMYRSEVGERAPDGSWKLTPYELAAAMSYLLIGTTPDDALLDAAATGALGTPEGIETQARRLLQDPRSRRALAAFFRQWLGIDGFLFSNKDTAVYPAFTDEVRKAMADEADAFVAHVTLDSVRMGGTGTFKELFTADYVFASDVLSRFYALPITGNPAPVRQPAGSGPGRQRGGALTLGAVLGAHAHSNESSPVRRGVFVRHQLLCQSLPSPPENLNVMPPGLDPSLTTRARFQRHSSDVACSGCHQHIDPVGFGFERYDGVGAYRETEAGMPIDGSGEVLGLESLTSTDRKPFDGPVQLGALIADSPNAQACFARQLYRYARGGEAGGRDGCAIKKLQAAFTAASGNIQQLFIEVLKQKSFRERDGGSR